MNEEKSPYRWANDISHILKTVLGADRFPVDVKEVAREFSKHKFPDDPITLIRGEPLNNFEGALVPAPPGKKGWGIFYNSDVRSPGRMNFTLGHEFGHYLLHRIAHPKGFQCSNEDMASWDSAYGQLEHQANTFAATLLMPLDDFRAQIDDRARPGLEVLGECAARYEVSLIASILRWLQFTQRRSMLVVSRDGFILWARSSKPAFESGLYYRTRNTPPIEIPSFSLAAQRSSVDGYSGKADHETGIWRKEPCTEYTLFSEHYDFTISLLHFDDRTRTYELEEEEQEDTYERMIRRKPGQSWLS